MSELRESLTSSFSRLDRHPPLVMQSSGACHRLSDQVDYFFYQSSLPGPGLSRAVVGKTGSVLPMGSDVVDSPSRNLRCHVVQCSYILCNRFCLSGSVRII